jgi:glycosyltransferase involved in cell wall biosynthesis
LETLRKTFDVTVLGINYRGDPHNYPYPIYAAAVGGDWMGVNRLVWMCDLVKPDIIVIQQDPWNIPFYMAALKKVPEYAKIPVVASVAIDGKNCASKSLDGVALTVFWTKFGLDEARYWAYEEPAVVIPLGVDLDVYRPMDKYEARLRKLPRELDDVFIVGNVNRNQPRKRWDLTIRYFAEWVHKHRITDAFLFLHVAPTGDTGVDVRQLAAYYDVLKYLIIAEPPMWYGIDESEMRETYCCFDIQMSTTQGEGFGLTTLEGMACGIPQIVPDWAALGEICKDAAWLIPCTTTAVGPPYVNVIGGIPDQAKFVEALDGLYRNPDWRVQNSQAGLERARQPRFRWENVGAEFEKALTGVLNRPPVTTDEKEDVQDYQGLAHS